MMAAVVVMMGMLIRAPLVGAAGRRRPHLGKIIILGTLTDPCRTSFEYYLLQHGSLTSWMTRENHFSLIV
jgi:hypothetical protein